MFRKVGGMSPRSSIVIGSGNTFNSEIPQICNVIFFFSLRIDL